MSFVKEIRDLMGRCSRLEQQVAKLPTRIGNSAGGSGSGGSGGWITALSYDALPDVSGPESVPGEVGYTKMAKITAGPQEGQIYKIRQGVWECVGETYDGDSAIDLPNGPYVQKYAVGRVGSIYYRRNDDNSGWEAQNQWT